MDAATEIIFRNPGERIGHENRERIRHLMITKLGITNVEMSRELGLNPIAVGKHVARIRKEWSE